jgi:hypothetical protein
MHDLEILIRTVFRILKMPVLESLRIKTVLKMPMVVQNLFCQRDRPDEGMADDELPLDLQLDL